MEKLFKFSSFKKKLFREVTGFWSISCNLTSGDSKDSLTSFSFISRSHLKAAHFY